MNSYNILINSEIATFIEETIGDSNEVNISIIRDDR